MSGLGIYAITRLKEVRLVAWVNPRPIVPYSDVYPLLIYENAQNDLFAARTEFNRVGKQAEGDLQDGRRIGLDYDRC